MHEVRQTVVVTGGSGFVGQHLLYELTKAWPKAQVVVWDRVQGPGAGTINFLTVDITEPASYLTSLKQLQPDWVVHLAAIAPIERATKDADLTWRVNVEASEQLLAAIVEHSGQTRVLAVSSADIYGRSSMTPLPELALDEARPLNPYAQSKLAMERIIEERFNDRVLRVRPFTHIGPGQLQGFVTADFASQIVAIERGEQEPVIRVGNLAAQRDFTDVRDVVRAYRLLMEKGELGEVYHVASERAVSIQVLLDKLLAQSEVAVRVEQAEDRLRPSDTPIVFGSVTKLRLVTGWEPTISLAESLRDILHWWREHPDYII